jgi:hypothetical protein
VSPWVFAIAGVVFCAAGTWAVDQHRRLADALAHGGEDIAQLDAFLSSSQELDASVLEARSGMTLNFDAIDRSVLSLRTLSRAGGVVRGRGAHYAEAADALERAAGEMRQAESSLETLKTDLALLRLSTRYFPIAAGALSHPDDATATHLNALRTDLNQFEGTAATPEVGWRISNELAGLDAIRQERELRTSRVNALRADVERYQEVPTREVVQRLEGEISVLEESRPRLDAPTRGDLDVLLGHTRAILDHRARVDHTVQAVLHSLLHTDLAQARAMYERSVRRDFAMASQLRMALAEIWAGAFVLFAAAAWTVVVRRERHR